MWNRVTNAIIEVQLKFKCSQLDRQSFAFDSISINVSVVFALKWLNDNSIHAMRTNGSIKMYVERKKSEKKKSALMLHRYNTTRPKRWCNCAVQCDSFCCFSFSLLFCVISVWHQIWFKRAFCSCRTIKVYEYQVSYCNGQHFSFVFPLIFLFVGFNIVLDIAHFFARLNLIKWNPFSNETWAHFAIAFDVNYLWFAMALDWESRSTRLF